MYCGVASMCTCTSSKNIQWPISSTFLLCIWAYLKLGNPEIHWLIIMFALKWRCYDMLWYFLPSKSLFYAYTQSSDTMHCSCCTTRTHWSGICIYIYVRMLYIYILYIHWNFQILLYTHIITHLSRWNRCHISFISYLYPMYILFHEYAMKSHDKKSRTAPWAKATCWAL